MSWLEGVWSAASEWFAEKVVLSGLDPLLRLLGGTVLAAPDPSCMPEMVELWQHTRAIAVGLYGVLVLVGALLVLCHNTVQTRYGARELAPRVVLGITGANLSLWFIGEAVTGANALTTAVLGDVNPHDAATALREMIITADQREAGLWLIFVVAAILVLVVIVLIGYVQRLALLAILTVAAPLALACYALPGLDRLAGWWWRALGAILGAQIAQALTLVVMLRVVLAPGGLGRSGQFAAEPDMRLILALGMVLIMATIPIHVMRAAKIGQGGSLLGSLVRSVLTVKTLGAIRTGVHAAGRRQIRPRGTRGTPPFGSPPSRPRSMLRTWPFGGSSTGPTGRTLVEARRAQRDRAPDPPRPRPNRLHPAKRSRPANQLHPPLNGWSRADHPRTTPATRMPPLTPRRLPPSSVRQSVTPRRTGGVDRSRASGRAALSHARFSSSSRTPNNRRRTY